MGGDPRVGSGVVGGCVTGLSVCQIRLLSNHKESDLVRSK